MIAINLQFIDQILESIDGMENFEVEMYDDGEDLNDDPVYISFKKSI